MRLFTSNNNQFAPFFNIDPKIQRLYKLRAIDNFCTHHEINLCFFEGGLLHDLRERLTGSQEVRGSIPLISTT